jgi:hypothetical protein
VDLASDRGTDGGFEDGQPPLDGRAGGHRRACTGGETADERRREPCRRLWGLARKAQRLEHSALFEGTGDLVLPVGAELLDPSVQFLTELAVEISRRLVARSRGDDSRAKVAQGDLIKLRNYCFGPVEPDRLLDRRGELLRKSEDRLAGHLGPAF